MSFCTWEPQFYIGFPRYSTRGASNRYDVESFYSVARDVQNDI